METLSIYFKIVLAIAYVILNVYIIDAIIKGIKWRSWGFVTIVALVLFLIIIPIGIFIFGGLI